MRDDDHSVVAGEAGGEGDRLAVVAAGGADDALDFWMRLFEVLHQDEAAANLEGSGGGVVFMFEPDFGAGGLLEYGTSGTAG